MFAVTLAVPLLIVTLVSVRLPTLVVVFPKYIAVLPSVIAVAKLLSSWDRGMAAVAVPNV
jgi:hypothetical protein